MKSEVKLLQERGMKEKDVREAIERAAARARAVAAYEGKGEITQDAMRKVIEQHAETDKQKGKI